MFPSSPARRQRPVPALRLEPAQARVTAATTESTSDCVSRYGPLAASSLVVRGPVLSAARAWFDSANMQIVIVGDREQVAAQAALFGGVLYYDVQGSRIS